MTLAPERLGLEGLPETVRSRVLQLLFERQRLEHALLMLPEALSDHSAEHTIAVIAGAACEVTSARVAAVLLPESREEPLVVGPDRERIDALQLLDFAAVKRAVAGGGIELVSVDTDEDGAPLGVTVDGREIRTLLALPVRARGDRILGVLVLAHHRRRAFSARQVDLAASLGVHLGHTLEITDAMAEHQRISAALQESLLPPLLPPTAGLDLAARYRPSGRGNLVGGDFYDVFANGGGGWSILLGDSSGIGPEAAGLAGIARYTARALAEAAPSPLEFLQQMNRAVLRAAPEGRFCSAVVANVAFVKKGIRVELASAGHPPALVQSGARVRPAMAHTGTILGVTDDPPFGIGEVVLAPGDALVLYTDGVVEARNPDGEFFGEARLATVLGAAAARSAEGIARRIEREVLDHRGPRPVDDVAIVVARVPTVPAAG